MPQIGHLRTGVCRDLGVGDEGDAVFDGGFREGMPRTDHSEMKVWRDPSSVKMDPYPRWRCGLAFAV